MAEGTRPRLSPEPTRPPPGPNPAKPRIAARPLACDSPVAHRAPAVRKLGIDAE